MSSKRASIHKVHYSDIILVSVLILPIGPKHCLELFSLAHFPSVGMQHRSSADHRQVALSWEVAFKSMNAGNWEGVHTDEAKESWTIQRKGLFRGSGAHQGLDPFPIHR